MNFFERLILGLLKAAPAVAPVFVHSEHGTVVLHASEALLAGVLTELQPTAPAPAVAPAVTK